MSAALELEARGFHVCLLDQGDVPHPLAASTDISKVIRMEYGPDELYMALMERLGRAGWPGTKNGRMRASGRCITKPVC